jgi:hypothetical protein
VLFPFPLLPLFLKERKGIAAVRNTLSNSANIETTCERRSDSTPRVPLSSAPLQGHKQIKFKKRNSKKKKRVAAALGDASWDDDDNGSEEQGRVIQRRRKERGQKEISENRKKRTFAHSREVVSA